MIGKEAAHSYCFRSATFFWNQSQLLNLAALGCFWVPSALCYPIDIIPMCFPIFYCYATALTFPLGTVIAFAVATAEDCDGRPCGSVLAASG